MLLYTHGKLDKAQQKHDLSAWAPKMISNWQFTLNAKEGAWSTHVYGS